MRRCWCFRRSGVGGYFGGAEAVARSYAASECTVWRAGIDVALLLSPAVSKFEGKVRLERWIGDGS